MKLLKKESTEEYFYNQDNKFVCTVLTTIYKIEFVDSKEYIDFIEKVSNDFTHTLKHENVGDLYNPIYSWVGIFILQHRVTKDKIEVLTEKR